MNTYHETINLSGELINMRYIINSKNEYRIKY